MLNKELKKDILKIILFTVSLIFLFIYIKPVWEFLVIVFNLVMPFLVGIAIAFVLNILVNLLERTECILPLCIWSQHGGILALGHTSLRTGNILARC
ncbi:MAG: hypothetical protein HFI49_04040, partial [Bacilli bacterium]|nr:hypothetical protein [Bacilli bacterium]